MSKVKVLFICMGNICRSPTAEAIFRARVEEAGLLEHILIDSCGTHDYREIKGVSFAFNFQANTPCRVAHALN